MRFYTSILFLFCAITTFGQFVDDFSDGDFFNPNWMGEVANFEINSGQLQLNAPSAGSSMIYLETAVPDSSIWDLWLKMEFSPSQSNQLIIYLMAESTDFDTADAIFLELGENGNDDAIKIKQRLAGVESLLAISDAASIATDPVELHLNIEKINDEWRLLVDFTGGSNLLQAANWSATVNNIGNKYFGLNCGYTATRVDKFFFDNISLQQWVPDTQAPVLVSAEATNSQEVVVSFDESLDALSLDVANFALSGSIGITDVDFVLGDDSKVILFLSQDLENGQVYTVSTTDIVDKHGNSGAGTYDFIYSVPESINPFDIIINELMADPTPSIGLPETEFVELYNRSDKVLNLNDLTLLVNTATRVLPDYNLLPGSFVLLVDEEDTTLWSPFGNVVGLDLPGLSNGGASLTLLNNTDVIHQIDYNSNSYRDSNKDDGGWSLELVNPENPCLGEGNWMASNNLQGGTPGKQNEVYDILFKNSALEVLQVFPNSATGVTIRFDQYVGANATELSKYSISPDLGIVAAVSNSNAIDLTLGSAMVTGVEYKLTIQSGVKNCINALPSEIYEFELGLAQAVTPGDVVINEILFNPTTGGSDYVELLNVSEKIIDISTLAIANTQKVGAIKSITNSGLLFPNQYVAFTPNSFQVITQYQPPDTAWILENDLPAFNDDDGNVTLVANGEVIDSVNYTDDMHSSLLSDKNGVALERINPNGDSDTESNWISAASIVNYGTPGYKNSQYSSAVVSGSDYVTIRQKVFSPNGDGFEDFVLFDYELPASGYTLNGRIYTASGQYVGRLSNNDILGKNGTIRWDGVDDLGTALAAGIYVIHFYFFRPDGDKIKELETCGIVRE